MDFNTTKAERIFKKLKIHRSSTNKHIKGFIVYNGERLFPPIYFSKGKKKIHPPITEKIRKSLFLTKDEFKTLSKCTMSYKEYFECRFKNLNDTR